MPGWNDDINTAIENGQGQVALCYYQTTNPLFMVTEEIGYLFQTHANICLAWVDREYAQRLLDLRAGCCGGKRPVIRVASQQDVDRWSQVLA